MITTKPFFILAIMLLLYSCQEEIKTQPVQVIPEPLSIQTEDQPAFVFKEKTTIVINDSTMLPAVSLLQEILHKELAVVWDKNSQPKSAVVFEYDAGLDSLSQEGYQLQITKNEIGIRSAGPQGLFYAVQTLRQLLPEELEAETLQQLAVPAANIIDSPRFGWRGVHLDVSRHFMPLDFVKEYIDYLAMHKLNVFHWHLVDGIGWRIEIKSHPELTDIGAWRVVKEGKKPWQDFEVWKTGDSRPKYGGYYTQQEIKELVAYAKERQITVLPEIELPGHSEVVMQCYPDLLCKDKHGKSLKNIGVYCASNQDSYQLLEDVLDEVLELFPSEYIHIGGDEVGKSNWKACAQCQATMKKNGYTPHELQSHFVNHFDEYLKSKGRKLIGWHEILEGELSPSATIMYWGGEAGVTASLEKGHPMVLTTGSILYFDHYQSLSQNEPKAFGGYAPLKKVYNYEPVPAEANAETRARILGVQANLWTEYMPDENQVEYMLFPRIAALSEIAWQAPNKKDWTQFRNKMDRMVERYNAMGVNYAPSAYRPEIKFQLDQESKKLNVELETELHADIYYTLDGSEPDQQTATHYTQAFTLDQSTPVKAIAVKDGNKMVSTETKDAILHKACGADVTLDSEPYGNYKAQGGYTLVDADFGGDKWGNGKWLGILGRDFSATINLKETASISKVAMSCIEETGAGIYFPAGMEVAVSTDGKNFKTLKTWKNKREASIPKTPDIKTETFTLDFEPTECQYIRVKAPYQRVKNQGVFIFIDEVIVE
ncbi:glycoside hydrolase family 20 protein [Sunxiuqinia elliptica]|uniref:beta-N-acetylhexosaminidase n=1 Tax=Sunxiuqinia elliptica TaxID=655355 RepID=A0A1I2KE12_9BACT|nr:glycoside hydrolase family 20 protein [Sunxiuqinia elliptica]SFF64608.1 hexosaminidase [Sunxiuqinia elliptica]